MPQSKPGCYVALCISSTKMNPDDIASHLGLTPSRKIVMGTPTGEDSPTTHPYHLVLFPSGLSFSERMDVHIEHMVAVLEPCFRGLRPSRTGANLPSTAPASFETRMAGNYRRSFWFAWAGWVSHSVLLWTSKAKKMRFNMRLETDLRTRSQGSRVSAAQPSR